jgi:hypothetical protein
MYVEATLIGWAPPSWKPTKCFENRIQKNSKFSVLLCHVDQKTVTDILEERSASPPAESGKIKVLLCFCRMFISVYHLTKHIIHKLRDTIHDLTAQGGKVIHTMVSRKQEI